MTARAAGPADADLRRAVDAALADVHDPCSVARGTPIGLPDMGLVADVTSASTVAGLAVTVRLRLTAPGCLYFSHFETEVRRRVLALPNVAQVTVDWDTALDWEPSMMTDRARRRLTATHATP